MSVPETSIAPAAPRATTHAQRRAALAHLPGDFGPPVVGHTLAILRSQAEFTRRMHERFGPVHKSASFFEEYVMLLGPEANQRVLQDRDKTFTAGGGWEHHFGRLFPRSLLLLDFEEHGAHRRAMMEPFRPPALRSYVARMHAPIARAVESWVKKGSVRFYPAIRELTLELAAEIFLGIPLGPEAERAGADLKAIVEAAATALPIDLLGTPFARGLRARDRIARRLSALVEERRGNPGDDLLSRLITARIDGERPLDDSEIVDHLIFLVDAAHDTTTSALSTVLYHLAADEEGRAWQERLHALAADRSPNALSMDDSEPLALYEAVLHEALRLYPPVTAIPRRAERECELLGHRIPAGTTVYLSPVFTHRSPSLWRDPERFDPTRFLPPRSEHRAHPFAFIPFGGGPHACLGLVFARLQSALVMHHLFARARASLPSWHPRRFHWLPVPRPWLDLPLRLTPR